MALSREQVLEWLAAVVDPEIPVLTIADLGILRDVTIGDHVTVQLTPTYSGCPATEVIEKSVIDALSEKGIENVRIERVLSPAWTTDWISDEGREKLREYGIAPPETGASKRELVHGARTIACPRCASVNTAVVSEFGSTACKASYKCNDCLEPFEYFKCI
ncbi:MAG: phenylacetate-CoA oxygenase subunit PaaJ [Woeseiaceae bacterium]|nr:phenylacetate-CoA oxygenase subunit PaaJ [Woeseiaceae bacterium]NIP19553.1 phenylacetate-CoA oxygenase subunit PaaJ [Woeseiaceae bacterium]NIS88507.1 phenylacetate-CoA oxygenase subunit PaaJ [Woeseiaceae bacterium]